MIIVSVNNIGLFHSLASLFPVVTATVYVFSPPDINERGV